MADQYGVAGRDQYNIAGDAYLLPHYDDAAAGEAEDTEEYATSGGTDGGILGLIIFVAIIAVLFLWGASQSGDSLPRVPFPLRSSSWPAGTTAGAVMAPVIAKLQDCAQVPVLAPVNCPQSQAASYPGATNVHWSLHGNPSDGARIVYWKNKFYVAGNAIMQATYSDDMGYRRLSIQIVHYRAQLSWRRHRAELLGIQGVSAKPGPTITKHMPNVAWSQIREAVRSAFAHCAATRSASLPPQCPTDPNLDVLTSNARWRLTANPLLNAQESFDRVSGLIHVTGSYAMSATYSQRMLAKQHYSEAGNYNAIISDDHGQLDVLQIVVS